MIIVLITVLIFVFSLWYLVSPFFSSSQDAQESRVNSDEDHANDSLLLQKDEVLLSLKEFDLDYQMKKISKDDYEDLYQEALQEGSELLAKMDLAKIKNDKNNKDEPKAIKKGPQLDRRARVASGDVQSPKFCSECGSGLTQGAKFCSHCGSKILGL